MWHDAAVGELVDARSSDGNRIGPGRHVGGWLIERELGRGGMGVVYLARHPRLPKHDVVKVLTASVAGDKKIRARFENEAIRLSELSHPHVVPVLDRGIEGDSPFLVMQYVPGGDVRGLLNAARRLAFADAFSIIRQVADALDFAHSKGIVHRDVKPDNVLVLGVMPDGSPRVMLTDFGISHVLYSSERTSSSGDLTFTPAYAAPEQVNGDTVDGRADQYALASMFFELLVGGPPLARGGLLPTMQAQLAVEPPSLPEWVRGVRPNTTAQIHKALAKSPDKRHRSCRDFCNKILYSLSTHTVVTLPYWQDDPQFTDFRVVNVHVRESEFVRPNQLLITIANQHVSIEVLSPRGGVIERLPEDLFNRPWIPKHIGRLVTSDLMPESEARGLVGTVRRLGSDSPIDGAQ